MVWFGFYAGSLSQIHCSMPYYVGTNNSTWYDLNPNFSNVQISFQINTWYNFTATYNNSTRLLSNYINGRFAVSGTRPGLGDLNNPNGSPIQLFGCNGVSSQNSQQRFFSMYNYALSQAEVIQNYNALRGRFELQ